MMNLFISRGAASVRELATVRLFDDFVAHSSFSHSRNQPGAIDFTFGNPHDAPQPAFVAALREALEPRSVNWFAYKEYVPTAQAAADGLRRLVGIPFSPKTSCSHRADSLPLWPPPPSCS